MIKCKFVVEMERCLAYFFVYLMNSAENQSLKKPWQSYFCPTDPSVDNLSWNMKVQWNLWRYITVLWAIQMIFNSLEGIYQFMNLFQIPENQNWKNNPRIFYNGNEINMLMPFAISLWHFGLSLNIEVTDIKGQKKGINKVDWIFSHETIQRNACAAVIAGNCFLFINSDNRNMMPETCHNQAQIFADRQLMVSKFWSKYIQGKVSVWKLQYFCGLPENQKRCLEKLILYTFNC